MSNTLTRRYWGIDCPHVPHGLRTSGPNNPLTDFLSRATDNGGGYGFPWPGHLWHGALGSHHSIRSIHHLSSGHWTTFSDVVKYWGPTLPSCYSIDRVGRLACQTHQTVALSCFFMGITLTQSFLVVPTCLSPCSKRAIFCFTPDSPTIPSSFSSKPHSLTHRFPY